MLNHGARIVTDGLVLCLDTANPKSYPGSGTTWFDLSGNGNNGTLVNGVGYSGDNKGALTFDGVDDAVINSNFASFISGNLVGSVSLWFLIPSSIYQTDIEVTLFNVHQTRNNPCTISFNKDKDVANYGYTSAAIRISDDNGGTSNRTIKAYYDSSNSSKYFDDTWHNIVLTCGSDFNKLYVDGDNVQLQYDFGSSNTGNFLFRSNTNIFDISGSRTNTNGLRSSHFSGKVSSCLAYNRPLSAEEIKQNFNALRGRYNL